MDQQSVEKFVEWFSSEWIKGAGRYTVLPGPQGNTNWVSGLIAADMKNTIEPLLNELVRRRYELQYEELKKFWENKK